MRVDIAGCAQSPSKRERTETSTAAEERPVLRFAKLTEHATTPTRGSAKAAGYDLYRLFVLHIYITFLYLPTSCTKIRPCSVLFGNIMKLIIWLYNGGSFWAATYSTSYHSVKKSVSMNIC